MTAAVERGARAGRRGRPSRSVLPRPRLEKRLDDAFGKRLTLVVADAGFGKSTVVADWTRDLDAVYLTLSAADRNTGTFVHRTFTIGDITFEIEVTGFFPRGR